MRRVGWILGAFVLAAHAALFVLAVDACRRPGLRVEVATGTTAAPATKRVVGHGPGVERTEWRVRYRGGFERSVGVTRLLGPAQDLDDPPCDVRLHIGQAFLDDGKASPGTVAYFLERELNEALHGEKIWGVGRFEKVSYIAMRWTDARGGAVRIDLKVRFSKASLPVTIHAMPVIEDRVLRWETETKASVRFQGRARKFFVALFRLQDDADDIATGESTKEVHRVTARINDALGAPPPVELGDGRALQVVYCDEPVRVVDRTMATIPFAIVPLDRGKPLPVHRSRTDESVPALDGAAPLTMDMDLDAINAVLHFLFATGALDEEIERAGVKDWFNEASMVKRFLSVRIDDLRLAMTPDVALHGGPRAPFEIAAEARLVLVDGDQRTAARLFGRVAFDLDSDDEGRLRPRLHLDELALSCEPSPGILEPCYGAVVEAARRHAPELHGPVADALSVQFDSMLRGRNFGDDTAYFHVDEARVSVHPAGASGWLRVRLGGRIHSDP